MSNWTLVKKENETTGRGKVYAGGEYKSTVRDMEPVFLEQGDVFMVPLRGEGATDVDKDLRLARYDTFVGNDGKERAIDFVYVKLVPQKQMTDEEKKAYDQNPEVKKVYLNSFTRSVRQCDDAGHPVWGEDGLVKASGSVINKYQEFKTQSHMAALDAIAGKLIRVDKVEYVRNRFDNYQSVLTLDFVE